MSRKSSTIRKHQLFARPLGEAIAHITKPMMKKHGLPDGLIQQWNHIAGKELAAYCLPVACKRSKKQTAATLVLEIMPCYALMAQHASGIIIEKINLHYGYRVIERVQFKPSTQTLGAIPAKPSVDQQEKAEQFAALVASLKANN